MIVIIISGFAQKGKSLLIGDIVDWTLVSSGNAGIDVLLFDLREGDLDRLSGRDGIEIREMGGGCPCCALEGKIRKMLKAASSSKLRSLIIETSGGCDLQRMKAIVQEESVFADVTTIVVVELPTMKVVLEVVPVMMENIVSSDLLVITEVDGSDTEVSTIELREVLKVEGLDQGPVIDWMDIGRIIPLTSAGRSLIGSYHSYYV